MRDAVWVILRHQQLERSTVSCSVTPGSWETSCHASLAAALKDILCEAFHDTSIKRDAVWVLPWHRHEERSSQCSSVKPASRATYCELFRDTNIKRHAVWVLPWHQHDERRSVNPSVKPTSKPWQSLITSHRFIQSIREYTNIHAYTYRFWSFKFMFFELLCNWFLSSNENSNYSSYSKILNTLQFRLLWNFSYSDYSKVS